MDRSTPSAAPTDDQRIAVDRARVVRDALAQNWTGELRLRRDDLVLVVAKQPRLFTGAAAAATGVDAWVRLYRDFGNEVLDELPVDPHRIFTNPPTRTVKGGEENAAAAFEDMLWTSVLTNPNPPGWRTRGTVTTVFSVSGDGYLRCIDTAGTYANARNNTGTATVDITDTTGTSMSVGQFTAIGQPRCFQGFVGFDTSAITDTDIVTVVTLDLWLVTDGSNTDFTAQARDFNWGGTLTSADYIPGTSLASSTLLATLASSGIGASGAYKTFTSQAAFLTATNIKTGTVYINLASDRQVAGNAPSGPEQMDFSTTDTSGTTQDPKLTITHNAAVFAPPPPPPPPNRIWTVY